MSILLSRETTFIVQGITGARGAVNLTRECLDYGSKIVGGVTPGRKGPRRGTACRSSTRSPQAIEHHGGPIDGSRRHGPPRLHQRRGLRGDPQWDQADRRRHRADPAAATSPRWVELASMEGARIIGPPPPQTYCLGLNRPRRLQDGRDRRPGQRRRRRPTRRARSGVMSRSGGMTTEISSSLTQAGLGVSTAVSIGGERDHRLHLPPS